MLRENVRLTIVNYSGRIACAVVLLAAAQTMHAQGIFGTNLIVNGNAEAGSAGTATTPVASIPGWTLTTRNVNVLPYGLAGHLLLTDPAPPDHGFQYFAGDPDQSPATITQTIDVSSGASTISGGNVKYTASAYLHDGVLAQMIVAFQNASGQ